MRKTLEKGKPTASLRFLYNTRFGGLILKLCTARWVSKLVGKFLDCRLSKGLIKRYIKKHQIDTSLYLDEKYKSFNAFFTRRIKPENRPFAQEEKAFPSPCDGKLSVYPITEESSFEIKGFSYTVESLLKNAELAQKYRGGTCVVLRLSVEDYHRYHYLDGGTKGENVFIRGKLHTVQPAALEKRRVFSENCREYTVLHTNNFGDVTQVEVGAMMVGRIVNFHGAGEISRGQEKGKFEFGGSTIALLIEKDAVRFDEEFWQNTRSELETVVKCGEQLGYAL